jgi:hypothetical protein
MKYYLSALVGFVLMFTSSMVNAEIGRCCIAGAYNGEHSDAPSKTCKEPKTEKFTMVINQTACGKTITGEVTDSRGDVSYMTGEVGKGCVMSGSITKSPLRPLGSTPRLTPGSEVTTFKGTVEKDSTIMKLQVTDGTYKSSEGCSGTFRMKQR